MKKIIIVALTSAVLVGCTTAETSQGDVFNATFPPATQPSSFYSATEEIYLETIKEQYPYVYSEVGADELIEFGNIICDAISDGLTLEGLAQLAIDANADPGMVGYITGAAIPTLCPENMWFINSSGA